MKVWVLVGDTYESNRTRKLFKDKPSREQVTDFMCQHYECSKEELVRDDYTIRSHRWNEKGTCWLSKVRNFEQYLDDIMNGIDGNDGEDYGTYFSLTEEEVL